MVQLNHVGVLATDGGPHPADKWAEASANEIANIVIIDDQSISDEAKKARKAKPRLALDLADVFEDLHEKVIKHEKDKLAAKGADRLHEDHDHGHILDEAVKAVQDVTSKTMFANEFKTPRIMAKVREVLEQDMATIAHIERSWYADGNLHDPKAKSWHNKKHGLHAAGGVK